MKKYLRSFSALIVLIASAASTRQAAEKPSAPASLVPSNVGRRDGVRPLVFVFSAIEKRSCAPTERY
jgi:hypothetical protein